MAQRRMFSPDIVESDAFLDMPTSSQALYFHLGMYADDDGFVNPKRIMRMMNVSDDDIKVLVVKRFVLPFENGVVVIKHWRINNLIRKDWYKETQYLEQKNQLKLKENGSYTELVNENVPNSLTQVRLGKVSLGKFIPSNEVAGKEVNDLISLFKEINPSYENLFKNKTQRLAMERMLRIFGKEKLEEMIKVLPQVNRKQYWPKSTTPLQLENNIPIYKAKMDEEKDKVDKNSIVYTFT